MNHTTPAVAPAPGAADGLPDPRDRLEAGPMTSVQITAVLVCWLIDLLDGMDTLAIAFTAPRIAEEWALAPTRLGIVFSAGLLGMTLGALFIAPLSDRFGRRRLILGSLAVIGIGMVATAQAASVVELALLRVFTGLGIGATLAVITAMVAEYSPDRYRNLLIGVLHFGYPVGAIAGGYLAAELIAAFGWRSVFLAGGAITLAMVPVTFLLLPESVHFLIQQRGANALARVNAIIARNGWAPLSELPPAREEAGASGVRQLLLGEYRLWTLLLWLAFFMAMLTLYFLLSWIPKIVVDAGLPVREGIYANMAFNGGGAVGMTLLGYFSARTGLRPFITGFMVIGIAVMALFARVDSQPGTLLLVSFFIGFFVLGGFIGLYAVAARLYPTRLRSTGLGWAIGVGRLGAIAGPSLGGVLIEAGFSIAGVFAFMSVPLLFTAVAMASLRSPALAVRPQPG